MTEWLADKSAINRILDGRAIDQDLWMERIEHGRVRMSTVTRLEIGYSARNAHEIRTEFESPPFSYMPIEYLSARAEDRAFEVQTLLAERGHHRGPSVPDLLIAASAELGNLTILAADKDFSLISHITFQPVENLRMVS
jgi:predicted nucleic acid-binding protein